MGRKQRPGKAPVGPARPEEKASLEIVTSDKVANTAEASVKGECEKALVALRRGNSAKSVKLIKDVTQRYPDVSLGHRVNGHIHLKLANLIDDPAVKQRHFRTSIDAARQASVISPRSVEYSHFYAQLLFEAANDSKGYDLVVKECERVLSVEEPIDPAKESLQEEQSQDLQTPEARIGHMQQELRQLVQKANIASLSTWVKSLGSGSTDEKLRFLQVRKLTEDPMEQRLAQPKRPHEVKKSVKTAEERRQEIEVRVAAARLLQQRQENGSSSGGVGGGSEGDDWDGASWKKKSVGERRRKDLSGGRKGGRLTLLEERTERLRPYWRAAGEEMRQALIEIEIAELKETLARTRNHEAMDALTESLRHAQELKTWRVWVCCRCGRHFADREEHSTHVLAAHAGGALSRHQQKMVPQDVDPEWAEMLSEEDVRPVDGPAAVRMLTESAQMAVLEDPMVASGEANLHADGVVNSTNGVVLLNAQARPHVEDNASEGSDGLSSQDSSGSLDRFLDPVIAALEEGGNGENTITLLQVGEGGDKKKEGSRPSLSGHAHDCNGECQLRNLQRATPKAPHPEFLVADDEERRKLLGRVHQLMRSLLRGRCITQEHALKVVQFALQEIQGMVADPSLHYDFVPSPVYVRFLEAPQLKIIVKYLSDLAKTCGLDRAHLPDSAANDGPVSGAEEDIIQDRLLLNEEFTMLVLDERILKEVSPDPPLPLPLPVEEPADIKTVSRMEETEVLLDATRRGHEAGEELKGISPSGQQMRDGKQLAEVEPDSAQPHAQPEVADKEKLNGFSGIKMEGKPALPTKLEEQGDRTVRQSGDWVCEEKGKDPLQGAAPVEDPSLRKPLPLMRVKKGEVAPPHMDLQLAWILGRMDYELSPAQWRLKREDATSKGIELIDALAKEFAAVKALCDKRRELAEQEEGLVRVEKLLMEGTPQEGGEDEVACKAHTSDVPGSVVEGTFPPGTIGAENFEEERIGEELRAGSTHIVYSKADGAMPAVMPELKEVMSGRGMVESRGMELDAFRGAEGHEAKLRARMEHLEQALATTHRHSSSRRREVDVIRIVLREAGVLQSSDAQDPVGGLTGRRLGHSPFEYSEESRARVGAHIENIVGGKRESLQTELNQLDAKLLRSLDTLNRIQQSINATCVVDYREVLLPLVKAFLQNRLEAAVEKDATLKSDAAQEAFLAELAKDELQGSGELTKEKLRDKKKGKENKKSKNSRRGSGGCAGGNAGIQDGIDQSISARDEEEDEEVDVDEEGVEVDDVMEEARRFQLAAAEEEARRLVELEEEQKLAQALEKQRRLEEDAKLQRLAQIRGNEQTTLQATPGPYSWQDGYETQQNGYDHQRIGKALTVDDGVPRPGRGHVGDEDDFPPVETVEGVATGANGGEILPNGSVKDFGCYAWGGESEIQVQNAQLAGEASNCAPCLLSPDKDENILPPYDSGGRAHNPSLGPHGLAEANGFTLIDKDRARWHQDGLAEQNHLQFNHLNPSPHYQQRLQQQQQLRRGGSEFEQRFSPPHMLNPPQPIYESGNGHRMPPQQPQMPEANGHSTRGVPAMGPGSPHPYSEGHLPRAAGQYVGQKPLPPAPSQRPGFVRVPLVPQRGAGTPPLATGQGPALGLPKGRLLQPPHSGGYATIKITPAAVPGAIAKTVQQQLPPPQPLAVHVKSLPVPEGRDQLPPQQEQLHVPNDAPPDEEVDASHVQVVGRARASRGVGTARKKGRRSAGRGQGNSDGTAGEGTAVRGARDPAEGSHPGSVDSQSCDVTSVLRKTSAHDSVPAQTVSRGEGVLLLTNGSVRSEGEDEFYGSTGRASPTLADDDVQFKADMEAAVRQSLDEHNRITSLSNGSLHSCEEASIAQATDSRNSSAEFNSLHTASSYSSLAEATKDEGGAIGAPGLADEPGKGLQNEIGQYNCFLNVVIQSLWRLECFREALLHKDSSQHVHQGDPCVVCALREIMAALKGPDDATRRETAVAPTALRLALSAMYSDTAFFQENQMNDASEVLEVVFNCLHRAFAPTAVGNALEVSPEAGSVEEGSQTAISATSSSSLSSPLSSSTSFHSTSNGVVDRAGCGWDCPPAGGRGNDPCVRGCMAHELFGLDVAELMKCLQCGMESRHLQYSAFFYNLNASSLRIAKIANPECSMDELLNIVEENHMLPCDPDAGGCSRSNHIHHILRSPPHVFTIVLGWQNVRETLEDISSTMDSIDTKMDVSVVYRGLPESHLVHLVSVVCYYGQHYHCFALNPDLGKWVMFDDTTVKVVGDWEDVTSACRRGHLQPQVLFFQAAA